MRKERREEKTSCFLERHTKEEEVPRKKRVPIKSNNANFLRNEQYFAAF